MLGTIYSKKQIATDCVDMTIEAKTDTPLPGQFLHILCGDGNLLRRPISICGYKDGLIRIVFAIKGSGTKWLANRSAGERIDFLGPLGNGFPTDDQPTLFVGGGIGTPPMLCCDEFFAIGQNHAVLGFRNKAFACLYNEFSSVEVLTDDGSMGAKGYPHEAVGRLLQTGKFKRVFTCGAAPMMKAVAKVCGEANVPCYVSLEERMGCAVGACLVCACSIKGEYRHVCKDGPVFLATDVDSFLEAGNND